MGYVFCNNRFNFFTALRNWVRFDLNNVSIFITCSGLQRCINVFIALVASDYFIAIKCHCVWKAT